MFRNILVPLDGSTRAEQAVGLAQSVAKSGGGRITLVQVVNNFDPLMTNPYEIEITGDNGEKIVTGWITKVSEYLTRVAEGVNSSAVSGVGTKVVRGNATEALCA